MFSMSCMFPWLYHHHHHHPITMFSALLLRRILPYWKGGWKRRIVLFIPSSYVTIISSETKNTKTVKLGRRLLVDAWAMKKCTTSITRRPTDTSTVAYWPFANMRTGRVFLSYVDPVLWKNANLANGNVAPSLKSKKQANGSQNYR